MNAAVDQRAEGLRALVDGLVQRLTAEMEDDFAVIATGGLSGVVATEAKSIDQVVPDLTLEGLRIIWHRNASN